MLAYDWPGNVGELENCLERACAFTTGPTLHVADLPPAVSNLQASSSAGGGDGASKIVPCQSSKSRPSSIRLPNSTGTNCWRRVCWGSGRLRCTEN